MTQTSGASRRENAKLYLNLPRHHRPCESRDPTTGLCCCAKAVDQHLSKQPPRRMGPCFPGCVKSGWVDVVQNGF